MAFLQAVPSCARALMPTGFARMCVPDRRSQIQPQLWPQSYSALPECKEGVPEGLRFFLGRPTAELKKNRPPDKWERLRMKALDMACVILEEI
jgi:hypothetical protein